MVGPVGFVDQVVTQELRHNSENLQVPIISSQIKHPEIPLLLSGQLLSLQDRHHHQRQDRGATLTEVMNVEGAEVEVVEAEEGQLDILLREEERLEAS